MNFLSHFFILYVKILKYSSKNQVFIQFFDFFLQRYLKLSTFHQDIDSSQKFRLFSPKKFDLASQIFNFSLRILTFSLKTLTFYLKISTICLGIFNFLSQKIDFSSKNLTFSAKSFWHFISKCSTLSQRIAFYFIFFNIHFLNFDFSSKKCDFFFYPKFKT